MPRAWKNTNKNNNKKIIPRRDSLVERTRKDLLPSSTLITTVFLLIVSTTKFSIVAGFPRAYFLPIWRAITWVSNAVI